MRNGEDANSKEVLRNIKGEILKSLERLGIIVKKIILFGSRARGDFSKSSDYDLLIVTEKTFTFREKMKITGEMRKILVKFHIPSDIIIKSVDEIDYFKDKIGSVVREALKEGISI